MRRESPSFDGSSSDSDDERMVTRSSTEARRSAARTTGTGASTVTPPPVAHAFPPATLLVAVEKDFKTPRKVSATSMKDVFAGHITDEQKAGPQMTYEALRQHCKRLAESAFAGEFDASKPGELFALPRDARGRLPTRGLAQGATPITSQ